MTIHPSLKGEELQARRRGLLIPQAIAFLGFSSAEDGEARSGVASGSTGSSTTSLGGTGDEGGARPDLVFVAAEALTTGLVSKAVELGVAVLVVVGDPAAGGIDPDEVAAATAFARAHGAAVLRRSDFGLIRPGLGFAAPRPGAGRFGAPRAGGVALVGVTAAADEELLQAAIDHGVGVSVHLSAAPEGGLDPADLVTGLLEDRETRAICLDLDAIGDPHGLVAVAEQARAAGKALVVLRSASPSGLAEVRPGIRRRSMIEAALTARGVRVVDTAAAAVVSAEVLAHHPDGLGTGVTITAARARSADRLRAALADRFGSTVAGLIDVRLAPEGVFAEPSGEGDAPVVHLVGDDALGGGVAADRDGVARLSRIEDVVDVAAGLIGQNIRPHSPEERAELEPDFEIALGRFGEGELGVVDATDLIAAAGIASVPFVTVKTGAEAVTRALDLGFPVVAKVIGKDLVEKAEQGGVALDVGRMKDLRRAVSGLHVRFGDAFQGALLQPYVPSLLEIEVGAFHDDDWGAFVWLRSAGHWRTAVDDLLIAPAPLDRGGALDLLGRLGSWANVGRAADPEAKADGAAEAVVALSRLAAALGPRLVDVVLHPLALHADRDGASALDVRLRLGPEVDTLARVGSTRLRGDLRRAVFPPAEPLQRIRRTSLLRRL